MVRGYLNNLVRFMSTTAQPVWPQPIPIIGGTGDRGHGKSKFGLNICPGNRTTLVYDLEQSSASYEGEYERIGVPFDRIDVQRTMYDVKLPNGTHPFRKGYKDVDMFKWWWEHILAIPAGKYRVIMVDPVTDLESGLVDWVDANPAYFGHTAGQYASMSAVKWGDVKALEKRILSDICARCECFYFTAHLGAEFGADKKPTGKKKMKGKETLFELASLYLWFDRSPDAKGARPNVPNAMVMKGRQERAELIDGEVVSYSILPPRLPVATPKAIRDYFKNPAGKGTLKDGEKVKEETAMSADDRLKLEVAKAEAERDAAQARAAVAQAQHTTVITLPSPNVEPEPTTLPEEWELSYRTAIDYADTPDMLSAIPPQINVSLQRGHIGQTEVANLKAHYQKRKAHLEMVSVLEPTNTQ